MKTRSIILYHTIYWIYRLINNLIYNYILFNNIWSKAAFFVQFVLMPFFYWNYRLIIPLLLKKRYAKFLLATVLWSIVFIIVYSRWSMSRGFLFYGKQLIPADFLETMNNLIHIWIISTGFCLFEYWINTHKNNQYIALEQKIFLLKSEENKMLNQLLPDYLTTLEKQILAAIPERVLHVSDFFKYVLYNKNTKIPLRTEMSYLRIYEEIKNSDSQELRIHHGNVNEYSYIQPLSIILLVNRLVLLLSKEKPLNISVESYTSEIRIKAQLQDLSAHSIKSIQETFSDIPLIIEKTTLILPIKQL